MRATRCVSPGLSLSLSLPPMGEALWSVMATLICCLCDGRTLARTRGQGRVFSWITPLPSFLLLLQEAPHPSYACSSSSLQPGSAHTFVFSVPLFFFFFATRVNCQLICYLSHRQQSGWKGNNSRPWGNSIPVASSATLTYFLDLNSIRATFPGINKSILMPFG